MKNSFYEIAVMTAKKNAGAAGVQLALIDNFTMSAPILHNMPFQKASHSHHHVYARLLDAQGLKIVDFDGRLPEAGSSYQLEEVKLTPFGAIFPIPEDLAIQAAGSPEGYLNTQVPPAMRKTGMDLEKSLYCDNFLKTARDYGTAMSATANPVQTETFDTMVAIDWQPGEMTGLVSPLPYGAGSSFGQLFETKWLNNKQRHKLENGVIGYAATVKIFIGILLANKRKISALVNIKAIPTPKQLATLVETAEGTGNTRIYCTPGLKTAIAAEYAHSQKGHGFIGVSSAGEVSVLGVPIVTSHNIPPKFQFIDAPPVGVQ